MNCYREACSHKSAVTADRSSPRPDPMQKPAPQAPELKTLLAHLQTKTSPTKILRARAEVLTTEIIALCQRQSRLKK